MMESGDAHRFAARHLVVVTCGVTALVVAFRNGQPMVLRYVLPKLARGDILLVESFDEADDTFDLGDQPSESLAESLEAGGDVSQEDETRVWDRRGLRGKTGMVPFVRIVCPKPFRDGGGDMGFCWGD